jgi:hypothetical protein
MTSKTTSSNPWGEIPKSSERDALNTLKVAADLNPNRKKVYWAKGAYGKPALMVEYADAVLSEKLPNFKCISVRNALGERTLLIELQDADMTGQFLNLCCDIVEAIQVTPDDTIGKHCLQRLEYWVHLLAPGRRALSPEAQKGLIAELLFLEQFPMKVFNDLDALEGWVGPDGAKRDFAYGQTFVECKCKRGSSNTTVCISSEEQLNTNPSERVFLYVIELNSATDEDESAFTLGDVAERVVQSIENPLLAIKLQTKLAKVGYSLEDIPSYETWSKGTEFAFEVKEDFPCIDTNSCMPGVSNVTYKLDLSYCTEFEVEPNVIMEALR